MQLAPQIDIDRAVKLVEWLKKFEGTILHTPTMSVTQQKELNVRFKIMIDKVEPFNYRWHYYQPRGFTTIWRLWLMTLHQQLIENVILAAWHLVVFAAGHSHQFDNIGHMVFSLHRLWTILGRWIRLRQNWDQPYKARSASKGSSVACMYRFMTCAHTTNGCKRQMNISKIYASRHALGATIAQQDTSIIGFITFTTRFTTPAADMDDIQMEQVDIWFPEPGPTWKCSFSRT